MAEITPDKDKNIEKKSVFEIAHEEISSIRDLIHPDVIQYEGGDIKAKNAEERIKVQKNLDEEKRKRPHTFYRDIIFSLIGVRLDEKRARSDWQAILDHKYLMSEKLERNVGVKVAALDYYSNFKRNLRETVMVDAETLADTVEQSITDGLTGAYNRRYFDSAMEKYFRLAQDKKEIFCLLMLDVDHFKIYNDANGHLTGDFALSEIVRILHAVTRPEDIVARYGGEEFAVIFPYLKLPKALNIAEAVRLSFADYRFPGEGALPNHNLTVSGGITAYTENLKDVQEMIKESDSALYQAKHEGRNRIICYKEIV